MFEHVTSDMLHNDSVLFISDCIVDDLRVWLGAQCTFEFDTLGAAGERLEIVYNETIKPMPHHGHNIEKTVH